MNTIEELDSHFICETCMCVCVCDFGGEEQ